MPAITRLSDPNSIFALLESVELSVAVALAAAPCSINVTSWRRIVGWADPPTDCCPSISVWGDNFRQDPNFQLDNGNSTSRASCGNAFLLDIHIRVDECYLDTDADGNPLPQNDINESSKILYHDLVWCVYFAWWCQWVNGGIDEIDACTPVSIGPLSTYAAGGCAGSEFTITVAIQR